MINYIKSPVFGDFRDWCEKEFVQLERVIQPFVEVANDGRIPIREITTTTYTLALADERYLLKCTHASGCTVTVPPNSTAAFVAGSVIHIAQWGTAQVTVAAGSGVTVRSSLTLKTRALYAPVTLLKMDTNEWLLFGERE